MITAPKTTLEVIQFCQEHNLPADVVGRWVWLKFSAKPSEEIRTLLKSAGFRWIKSRGEWAHNCGYHTGRGRCLPRLKYGAVPVAALEPAGGAA